jgi:hypothetical protein
MLQSLKQKEHYEKGTAMTLEIEKLTDARIMREACAVTMGKANSTVSLSDMYNCEHSPIRTQLFWIKLYDIPAFVSTHLVRHKVGVEHFVKSLRDDRCGEGNETRNSPVNHFMLINAQALINMARKRLCYKAHKTTGEVMCSIVTAIEQVDKALAGYLVPECTYRNGCHELTPCGR